MKQLRHKSSVLNRNTRWWAVWRPRDGLVWGQFGRGWLSVAPHVDTCSLEALALGKVCQPLPALCFALSAGVELNVHEWDFLPETSVIRRLLWALGLPLVAPSVASLLGGSENAIWGG